MTDRPDIWNHLKDHEVFPPAEVCNRLQALLESGDASSGGVSEIGRKNRMEQLQQHEIAPPLFLREKIEQRSGKKVLPFRRTHWYISAAACLLLAITGWIIYRSGTTPAAQTAITNKKEQPAGPKTGVLLQTDTLSGKTDSSEGIAMNAPADTSVLIKPGKSRRLAFSIGGQSVTIADNDLLATFTSYTYPDVPAYLTRTADKPLKIYVDQYTNIIVSPAMLEMMKAMYEVRSNGKPARKARKAKRRLDSWKEMDQKRFDKGDGVNPLDPVDLGEFILK